MVGMSRLEAVASRGSPASWAGGFVGVWTAADRGTAAAAVAGASWLSVVVAARRRVMVDGSGTEMVESVDVGCGGGASLESPL